MEFRPIVTCLVSLVCTSLFLAAPLAALESANLQSKDSQHKSSETPQKGVNVEEPPISTTPLPPVNQSLFMEQSIQEHLQALRDGDPSKAYYAHTTADFQKAVSLSTFKTFILNNPLLSLQGKFALENVTFANGVAKVKGKLDDAYGGSTDLEFDLIQENGVWKIQRVDLFRMKRK